LIRIKARSTKSATLFPDDRGRAMAEKAEAPTTTVGAIAIKAATVGDVRAALAKGWADFRAAPIYGLFFASVYVVGGWLILLLMTRLRMAYLAYPMMAGFVMLAPFVASGLYEVSRRREKGLPLRFSPVLACVYRQGGREMAWMAFVTLFVFIAWMYQTRLLLALFLGFANFASFEEFLAVLISTPEGLTFLAVGHAVGAILSALLFSITVISFPLLLDRETDFISAMIASVRAVAASPAVMLGWAVFIVAAMVLAMLPVFLGLLVALPVLGHASWHLYRALVAPAADQPC
jgi:uncharacterized membrane protein